MQSIATLSDQQEDQIISSLIVPPNMQNIWRKNMKESQYDQLNQPRLWSWDSW